MVAYRQRDAQSLFKGLKVRYAKRRFRNLLFRSILSLSFVSRAACHFTISEKSQEFMSPNYLTDGYPNSQFCSWRFLVEKKNPQTEQILITFLEFHLQKGQDGDKVRIYSGWDDRAPLLAEFNGDSPPPAKGVASKSPVVYVVFKSDSQCKSKGFRGLFLNQRKWPKEYY